MARFFQLDEEHFAFIVSNKILSRFIALMAMPKGKNRLNKLKILSVIELHIVLYEEVINDVELLAVVATPSISA